MNVSQLSVLLAVVEAGSFTQAADEVRMTQSGVSHAISGLESELGVRLIERERHGVRPTEAGQKVLIHARGVLAHMEQIRQEAAATLGLKVGKVNVGSLWSISAQLLPGILSSFRHKYPNIELVWFEGTDQEVEEWVLSRTVDVGFVSLPCEKLETIPIAQDTMLVVLPESHPLCAGTAVSVEQLSSEPLISSKGSCESLVASALRSETGSEPNWKTEVRNVGTIVSMVREGLGLATLPEMALPSDSSGVCVLPIDPSLKRQIAVAARSFKDLSLATSMFVEQSQRWIDTHLTSG